MIWTLIAFGVTLWVLGKFAFPRIQEALDKRQKAIEEAIDAVRARPRARPTSCSRSTASGCARRASRPRRSSSRARKAAEEHERESLEAARQQREELLEQTRRDVEAETRRAIQEIRDEVADLTVLATEKVTRKTLTAEDQQRLVEEALSRARLLGPRRRRRTETGRGSDGGDRTGLRALAVRGRQGARQARRGQASSSASSPTRSTQNRELAVFFFSPYFSTEEKKDGPAQGRRGRRAELRELPRAADREAPHAGDLPHRGAQYDALWDQENQLLPVEVTSAVELDPAIVDELGGRIGEQTGQKVELTSKVDPDILGGIVLRVGNSILDASIQQPTRTTSQRSRQSRPEEPRKEPHADQARRDHQHPQEPHRGPRRRRRRPDRGRHRAVGRRRHRARPRPRELHVVRDARAAARRHRPGAEPRVRQRRRRAVRRLGEGRRGRHGQAHRPPARHPRRRGAARPHRRPARPPARRQGRHRDRPRRGRPSSRRRASSSASR